MKKYLVKVFLVCFSILASNQLVCENFNTLGTSLVSDAEYDETLFSGGKYIIQMKHAPLSLCLLIPKKKIT